MGVSISGWGRYPTIEAEVEQPSTVSACRASLLEARSREHKFIARGLGRSYGDSSLADHVLDTRRLQHFQEFDRQNGVVTCAAGVSLAEILEVFVPHRWFLPVTPGTQFVTIGGAIASDVHGKNHHVDGTFGQHVLALQLLLGNGEIVICSPTEHPELFRATCGGMGLTGVILSAVLQLRRINSSEIVQTTLKADTLESVLEHFEVNQSATYSVAWIDCLSTGKSLGRSLLMLGEHAEHGDLKASHSRPRGFPVGLLSVALNKYSIKAFNSLYYHRALQARTRCSLTYESYFYPLDKLHEWNRLYGKSGFLQYQFVLPKAAGRNGLREILERIAASGKGSFLAVLKVLGVENKNLLSFPLMGYTLALDFRNEPGVLELLDELDQRVLTYGGRLYLTKDARMNEATFKQSYPSWEHFEKVRHRYHAHDCFASSQSRRVGLQ